MGQIHFNLREIHQIGKRTKEWLIHPDDGVGLRQQHVLLAGISRATTGFRFVRPRPRMGQLLVCFRGEGRVWLKDGWRKCRAGSAYLTPAHMSHAYEAGKRWELGWIIFSPEAEMPLLKEPVLQETDPRPLELILRGLHHEITAGRDRTQLESWCLLLGREAQRISTPEPTMRLGKLWQTVQADISANWTLGKLAQTAGLGPENLRRISLAETGRSPMREVTRLRMRHASSLLTTGRKIEEVAGLTGYTNAFAFSTAFKRLMKASPSQFRG